jgi:hypothetical protein
MLKAATPAPAPAPGATAGSGQVTVTLTKQQAAALASLDRPYCRSCAVASVDAFCDIPYDFANPETKRRSNYEVVDWGKVTKVVTETGTLGERRFSLDIVYLQGQRELYRFDTDLLVGELPMPKIGDYLAICPEDDSNIYQLPGGPLRKSRAVITLSGPPRMADAAKYKAIHINELKIVAEAEYQRGTLASDRRYLVNGKVTKQDGNLWLMDRYWLEVPKGIKGADRVAAGKRLWFIMDKPELVDPPSGDKKRLVMHAVAVVDDPFP